MEFSDIKNFLKALGDKFIVSQPGAHLSVSVFADEAKQMFNFHQGNSKEYFLNQIEKLPHLNKGQSNMDKAVRLASREAFSLRGGTRQGSPKVLVLITAGDCSTCKESLAAAVEPLQNDGVQIVTLAIGNKVNKAELLGISSIPGLEEKSTSQLINSVLIQKISDAVCRGKS